MRKFIFLFISAFTFFQVVHAQKIEVNGRVLDSIGNPMQNVSVREADSRNGTVTDANGVFKISVAPGKKLIVSSVGYETREVVAEPNLEIKLGSATRVLSEVVVTALGIRRERKALGYAVSSVDKKDLEAKPEGDIARVLNGKAPGVNVLSTSGLSGSGTNIVIRGVASITGNSTPLFVVDGVPFNSSTNAQSDFRFGNQTSSRFLDLDPNTIERIDVLKGLSASTLFGEQGRNGVILITTKNSATRRINKKTEITLDQSFFLNKPANLPDYQDNWGGGIDNVATFAFSNWGARITNPPAQLAHPYDRAALNGVFPQYKGAKYDYRPYNSVENFFRTGVVNTTTLNLAGSGAGINYNMNYGSLQDEGFTPGNKFSRHTFGIGGNAKLNNNITASGTFNYVVSKFASPPTGYSQGSGGVNGASVFGDLIYTPRTIDLVGLPYENPVDKSSVYYRGNNDIQHPLWTVNNAFNTQKVNRIYGNGMLRYAVPFVKGLNLSYRLGYDKYNEEHVYAQNKGGIDGPVNGMYRTINGENNIWDHTFLINYSSSLTDNWQLNVDAGVNSREDAYRQSGLTSTQQLVYGLFDHSNFISHSILGDADVDLDYVTKQQSIGAFAQALLSYKEFVYFNLGGRNSWVSTLERGNNSLFYPSASVSFIPTAAFDALANNRTLTYLKFRAGYSTSARFPLPYNTRSALNIQSAIFQTKDGVVVNSNAIPDALPNVNLKPELLQELEFGMEARLFNNRASIDLTLYNRRAKDQIFDRDLDPGTGYTSTAINAGNVRNRGIELALGYAIIKNKNFTWQVDANFSMNRSRVSDIPEDVDFIIINGFSDLGTIAQNGKPLGMIRGSRMVRDPKNNLPVLDNNGWYVTDPVPAIIGDPNPEYRLVGINTISYKGLSFRMQWDFTKGGDIYSTTINTLLSRGLSKDTDFDRFQPLILPGSDGNGNINNIQTNAVNLYFENFLAGASELYMYDATNLRLREISLSYSLPARMLEKLPFGGISLTLAGQNLFYYVPNIPKYTNFDPETSSLGVANGRGIELLTAPSSKRFGGSIRVTF
jgi:TonB-linked SusC/RagA family outer membrane protein